MAPDASGREAGDPASSEGAKAGRGDAEAHSAQMPVHPPVRKRRPWRRGVLLLGLLVWGALATLTLLTARAPIEADLTYRAHEVLERTGESWASARFEGRDATLEGESLAEMARTKVRHSLEQMFGVRVVRDATTLLPERRPFTFTAVKDGKVIALSGYVPSADARQRIINAVRGSGFVLTGGDQLVRARGAPAGDFAALVLFGLDQLEKLPSGRITLSDSALAIEGRASDLETYDALARTMQGDLPQGMTLARFAVRPPVASPFLWSASREGRTLRLSGYVPSETVRTEVKAILEEALPEARIQDDTHLADGAPSTDLWLKAVRFAAQLLRDAPQLQVTLSDSALKVDGIASTFAMYDALAKTRRSPPEGFQITQFAVEPPRAVPFTWSLERLPDAIQLGGHAPTEEARRLLNDAVRSTFPGVPVRDAMRLATGGPAPEVWAAAANFAVTQLGRLLNGTAAGDGAQVTLSGEALDSAAYSSLVKALEAPPAGVRVKAQVSPPRISPYVFSVRRDGDGLTVSGFFPNMKVHDTLRADLERDFPGEKVNDVSGIGSGAPDGFLSVAQVGLRELARLENGELSLADTQLHLAGKAYSPAAITEIRAALETAIKPPFVSEVDIEATGPGERTDAQTCQNLLTGVMAHGTILFNPASAQIDLRSRAVLDRLAHVLQRCPDVHVEVAGHTDSLGQARTNQRLSEARASAVIDALGEAGVAVARLSATGYGASQPVATNDTEAGRARNRRIEFVVKEAAQP